VPARRGPARWASPANVAATRRKVEALLDSLHEGADAEEVRRGVVALGLEHHLVTKHTSLVAVDVTPARPDGADLLATAVPTNLPSGWVHESVFGELPQTATGAPLHALQALLALLAAAALRTLARRLERGALS
jgi:Ca-activated chloride channel family protein